MENKNQNGSLIYEIKFDDIPDTYMLNFFIDGVTQNIKRIEDCIKSETVDFYQLQKLQVNIYVYMQIYETYLKQKNKF